MNKKAFTFIELILVIILSLGIYAIYFANFNLYSEKQKSEITLLNLKESLLEKYKFENTLKLKCIENGAKCYVILDDDISEKRIINGLFKNKPDVYNYGKDMNKIEFENFDIYEVSFEYSIDKYNMADELVVVSDKIVYLFTRITQKPLLYESLIQLRELRENKMEEVRDAF